MKLVRFGAPGHERPGVWLENTPADGGDGILDVRGMAFDIEDFDAHFFSHWGLDRLRALCAEPDRKLVPAAGVRLGPPIARPGKIICLGKNYADHAVEFDSEIPEIPILFSKAATSVIGPFDPIVLPKNSGSVDCEVELAIVMGKRTKGVSEKAAMDHVAGFTVLNDVTDREVQKAGKQWFRAKSFDTFCPLGPFLMTKEEIADPQNLRLYSKVNGITLQDSNTAHMIFKIAYLISFISSTITLEPGDVIATGTPGGIGSARKPPLFLRPGDKAEIGVEQVGTQISPVVSA